jgi:hypothetical protein
MTYQDEINLLKRESKILVEELRRMYTGVDNGDDGADTNSLDEVMFEEDDNRSEDEFCPSPSIDAVDDETTIEAEERLGREMNVEDEIALLQRESTTSVARKKRKIKLM